MNNQTLNKLKPFLYGKLLGDANLERPSKDRRESRFKLEHSTKQKEYLLHCYQRLHNFCNNPFDRTRKLIYKGKIRVYHTSILQSQRLPAFTQLFNMWYGEKKILPNDLEQFFTAETLAYWYMDDGYIHLKERSSDIVFCTDSFSKDECERLIRILKDKFDLEACLYRTKNSHRVRIGKKAEVEKFKGVVRSYILPSLAYKILDC